STSTTTVPPTTSSTTSTSTTSSSPTSTSSSSTTQAPATSSSTSTSSTTTSSTTSSSSTLPPIIPPLSCVTDADCNDGGPCTDRRCAGGGCVYQPLVGFPGVECELGQGLAAPLCGPEAIDPTLQRVITR